ncbi:MAG: SurA N-terminal domain-containing protein [Nitrospinota bacterium]
MASIVLENLNTKAKKSACVGNINKDVVAEVDGEKIKRSDFKRYCQIQVKLAAKGKNTTKPGKEHEKRLLGSLVNYTLLLKEAEKRNLKAKDSEVERKLEQFIAKHGSQTAFQAYIVKQNLTIEDIKVEIVKSILISKLIKAIFPDFTRRIEVANKESSDPDIENTLRREKKRKIISDLYRKLREDKEIKTYLHK